MFGGSPIMAYGGDEHFNCWTWQSVAKITGAVVLLYILVFFVLKLSVPGRVDFVDEQLNKVADMATSGNANTATSSGD